MTATVSLARQRAEQAAHGISATILRAMPDLVAVRREDGAAGDAVLYQDVEIRGAVCATAEEAQILYQLACAFSARQILEIGGYVGWTTAHLAWGGAHVVCVEPFLEVDDDQGLKEKMSERARQRFLQNLARSGVGANVTLITGRSPEVLASLSAPRGFDLVFIDGWHQDGQPEADVHGVVPLVPLHGLIVLHDLWLPDVQAAARVLRDGYGYGGIILPTVNWLGVFSVPQEGQKPLDIVAGWPSIRTLLTPEPAVPADIVFRDAPDLLVMVTGVSQ